MARKCKICKIPIPAASRSETIYHKLGFCGEEHTVQFGRNKAKVARERQQAKETKQARERLKTRTEWLNDAQAVFNQYIRLRDAHLPCVSCGTTSLDVQYHAGHYRTRKAAPQLRFDEKQVWKQCATCNNHLSGNLIEYRRELLKRIGEAELDRIESDNSQSKWTIDDAKRIISLYKSKIKELKQSE